jgi:hypothetical protein
VAVHLPVFALLPGAEGRLGRLERVRVDGLDGKVSKDVFQPSGVDVVSPDLREGLSRVPTAVGALEVGKLDEGEHGLVVAPEGASADADRQVADVTNGGATPFAQGIGEILDLPPEGTLLLLERFDLSSESLQIVGLRKDGLAGKSRQSHIAPQNLPTRAPSQVPFGGSVSWSA